MNSNISCSSKRPAIASNKCQYFVQYSHQNDIKRYGMMFLFSLVEHFSFSLCFCRSRDFQVVIFKNSLVEKQDLSVYFNHFEINKEKKYD